MHKLVDQAGFTHARLADHGQYLSASRSRLLHQLLKRFDLDLPSYKGRKPTSDPSVETCAGRGNSRKLIGVNRSRNSLRLDGTDRVYLDETFNFTQRRIGHQRSAWS